MTSEGTLVTVRMTSCVYACMHAWLHEFSYVWLLRLYGTR